MNKYEVYQFFDLTIRYACRRVGAPEFGIVDHEELLQGMAKTNREVYSLLAAFLDAYQAWFELTNEIITQGRGGNLNPAEFQKLQALNNRRDETRKRLSEMIKTLPEG
jgi:hypothetical protein